MAARLQQLQSKAVQASQFLSKHGSTFYNQLLENNKQYIQHPPTVEKCHELSKQLFYTRLARSTKHKKIEHHMGYNGSELARVTGKDIPVRSEQFWKELDYVKHMWRNRKELRVEDAGIAALFGLELYAWFCVGEIVGRGFTLTGYHV